MSKFKVGDKVYYIGSGSQLKKDSPYDISVVKDNFIGIKGMNYTYISSDLLIIDDYFISELEYRRNQNHYSTNKFKIDDIVYYIGKNSSLGIKGDMPYKVTRCFLNLLDIRVDDRYNIHNLDVHNFISNTEYKKTKEKSSDQTEFRKNDVVYYIGHNAQLKKNTPYIILNIIFRGISEGEKCYSLTIRDKGGRLFDGFDSKYFISEETYTLYQKGSNMNVWSSDQNDNTHILKSDSTIRMQIFQDTKNDVLKWNIPYPIYEDWYRTILKLKNPKEAYLRFDVRKISDEWELIIYYHRDKIKDSTLIKKTVETRTLLTLVKKIQEKIEKS